MATENQNRTLGRGRLYFSLFKVDTTEPSGFRYFGNTPEFGLTIEVDTLDHFNADAGIKEKDDSVVLQTNRTGSFVTDAIKPETIAYFFFGSHEQETVVGALVNDEALADVLVGASYQLGYDPDTNPAGHRNVSNVVVNGDASVAASKAGTFSGVGTVNDTITLDGVIYTLKASPTTVAGEVLIGGSAAETAFALTQAINRGDGAGYLYGSLTTAHPTVRATVAGAVVTVLARAGGIAGNSIVIAEAGTAFSFAGAATALSGGAAAVAGVAALDNWEVDAVSGLFTILYGAPAINDGDDITVTYNYASGIRENILSGSQPVAGAMKYVENNPKGQNFIYTFPYVKLSPNGDFQQKGDEWKQVPFNVEILKLDEDTSAIYVDGNEFVR